MVLQNGESDPLTAGQIAAHLNINVWNVTRELQLGAKQAAQYPRLRRLHGTKVLGQGVGRGGQWRVGRQTYLDWLQIPAEDRDEPLGPDRLPKLYLLEQVAQQVGLDVEVLTTLIRQQRWPHIRFGRKLYLTHNQLERLRVQLIETTGRRRPVETTQATQ